MALFRCFRFAKLGRRVCCTLLGYVSLYMGDLYSGDKTVTIIADSSHARVIIQTYVRAWRIIARGGVKRATKAIKAIPSPRRSAECGSREKKTRSIPADFQLRNPRFASREGFDESRHIRGEPRPVKLHVSAQMRVGYFCFVAR